MIKVDHLTKRYSGTLAVNDLDFEVKPGVVTGFLGPNGSGKSTTMRIILGLDRPTSGTATISGQRYADLKEPMREVGALLDAKAVHPGRTARNHLRAMKSGDPVFFYHSGDEKSVVGLARVAKESYTDPTADDGDWSAVDIAAEKPLVRQVTLAQIKADKTLKEMVLAKQSRLSVSPVSREQFERLLKLAETKA